VAIQFARARYISRSSGGRAVRSAAYNGREAITAERTGEVFYFHAAEQERPDVLSRRWAWFEGQIDLDPERLVFVDETWAEQRKVPRAKLVELLRRAAPAWRGATVAACAASGYE
jgi:hypothetical protein